MATNKSILLLTAAVVGIVASSTPAHAGLFGHSKKWKDQQAALQAQQAQQAQAAYDAQQAAIVAQQQAVAAQQAQQQAAYEAQQRAYQQQQQQAAAPTIPYEQPQWGNQVAGQQQPVQQAPVQGTIDPLTGLVKPPSAKDLAVTQFRTQAPQFMPMYITQTTWTPAVEQQFSEFIKRFGAGVKARPMRTLNAYMRDGNVNEFASTDPAGVYYYSDCADLPYFLRSYFAYKNGLPMSIAQGATMNMQAIGSVGSPGLDTWSLNNPGRTDVSPYGNSLTSRGGSDIPSTQGRERNYLTYWGLLMDSGSTRTFMVSPLTQNYNLSDVYPVKLDRQGIRPGTLIHTDGHMLVVVNVLSNGDVELIDAHPDNSLQFKTLDPSKLSRARPDVAYGFFAFRPVTAVGGTTYMTPDGRTAIAGAKIQLASDEQLFNQGLWSMDQWFGPGAGVQPRQPVDPNAWKMAFKQVNFFDYLRTQLSTAVESSDDAAGDLLNGLCNDLKLRVGDVQKGIDAGMTDKSHPDVIPQDIYNADPNWESFATPSRDGRTRQSIINLPSLLVQKYKAGIAHQFKMTYSGTAAQYQQAVLAKIAQLDQTCRATYKNSAGQPVTMTFSSMIARAPRMSFDMNDCAEKRWGAQGAELATCRDQDPSGRWYNAEQSIRNTGGKLNDNGVLIVRSDRPISMDMLESGRYVDQSDSALINLGFSRSLSPNVKAYFSSQQFVQDLNK